MFDARVCEAAVWLTPLFVEDVDVGDKRDTRIPRQVRRGEAACGDGSAAVADARGSAGECAGWRIFLLWMWRC